MRGRPLTLFLVVLVVLVAVRAYAADAEWPCWRGANRDGRSPDTGLLKEWPAGGPKLVWKTNAIGHGFSSVVVSGGRIFTLGDAGDDSFIYALDMEGKLLWKQESGKAWKANYPGSRSTPTLDGGKLYALSGQGVLACHDAQSGRRLWSKETKDFGGRPSNWGYAESPLILGNRVVVTAGGKNAVVALDKTSGDKIWASTGFEAVAHYGSSIAVTHEKTPLIITGTGSGIFAVNADSGGLVWSNDFSARNTANCPTPAYADGFVFWANGYGKGGICLKLGVDGGKVTATRAWTTGEMDCHHGGYIIDNGYVYGNHGNGWVCLELKTGHKKWSESGVGKGSVCYADGMLYLFGERGGQVGLATCSPDGMQMKGTFNVAGSGPSWAHPVVIGGRLYVRYGTNLYCFDVKARAGR